MDPWRWALLIGQIILTIAGARLLLWLRHRKDREKPPPRQDDW